MCHRPDGKVLAQVQWKRGTSYMVMGKAAVFVEPYHFEMVELPPVPVEAGGIRVKVTEILLKAEFPTEQVDKLIPVIMRQTESNYGEMEFDS